MKLNKIDMAILALGVLLVITVPITLGGKEILTKKQTDSIRDDIIQGTLSDELASKITITGSGFYKPYQSISELVDDSDLVVQGTVVDQFIVSIDGELEGVIPEVWTYSEISVNNCYLGNSEDIIYVAQYGGTKDGLTYTSTNDPLLEKGDVAILFLKNISKSNFITIGGPQGRFVLQNDKVYSIAEIKPDLVGSYSNLKTKGMSLTEFIDLIKR